MSRIRYGTSSWSESSWVGPFYPPGTKPADFLSHYATQFDTVEVDSTYYALPSADLVRGWNLKTPAGFTLSAKFPRSIVHGGKTEKPTPSASSCPSTSRRRRSSSSIAWPRWGTRSGRSCSSSRTSTRGRSRTPGHS